VLGTGAMGAPMAENLARAGFSVSTWDPVPERAAVEGVEPAASAPRACVGVDAVLTVAPDAATTEETMFGPSGVASSLEPGTLWILASTVGLRAIERLGDLARTRDLQLVDAPMIGSVGPARDGTLCFLASGPQPARPACEPVFAAMGTRWPWLGDLGAGQAMKLVLNGWILTLIEASAESVAFAERLGLDPAQFLEILDGDFDGSPLLQAVGRAILHRQFEGGLQLAYAEKDLRLALEAADAAAIELALAQAAHRQFRLGIEQGRGSASAFATYLTTAGDGPRLPPEPTTPN
jgi:3-hydroxyisobutyrate dehydrogenase